MNPTIQIFSQDVQCHSVYSDGKSSIAEMVESAVGTGLKSIVITDHAKGWTTKDGNNFDFFPNCARFEKYLEEIAESRRLFGNKIEVYSGLEVEIGTAGELKLDKGIVEYVSKFKPDKHLGVDIVLGSIHSESIEEDYASLKTRPEDRRALLIQNMIEVIKNRDVDIFAHPFQALHGQFSDNLTPPETDEIIRALKFEWGNGHRIYFEINGKKYPNYEQWPSNKYDSGELSTHDAAFLTEYLKAGGKFVLGSDAHSADGRAKMDFSIIPILDLKESDIFIFTK